MGRGAGRSSPAGVLPWGVGEWPDPSPEHGPETPWGCPSGKCGPCPERRAGPALASQTRAACAWGQPQSCPRVLMPHPTLSLAPSVLSNSGLEPVLWGHGDGTDPTLGAPIGARTCCCHSLSSPRGLRSNLVVSSPVIRVFWLCGLCP